MTQPDVSPQTVNGRCLASALVMSQLSSDTWLPAMTLVLQKSSKFGLAWYGLPGATTLATMG